MTDVQTIIDAEGIATLARAPSTSLEDAAKLIQSFADATASTARLKALEQYSARTMEIVDAVMGKGLSS